MALSGSALDTSQWSLNFMDHGRTSAARLLLPELLSAIHLRDLQGGKLTLSSVLEINSNTLSDGPPQDLQQLARNFLKKLIMSNTDARNIKCTQEQTKYCGFTDDDDNSDSINPLDLIIALFHCADPFLQQEMVSKMSLCQFAVPLLLPNCDTQQSTLMLWAMRDLVKNYRLYSSSGDVTLVEDRVVEMEIPMVSFIRVGESSLSKSQSLNDLLSNSSQSNKAFIHRHMECGDVPRKISDGLVEISWYLPCGNGNIDMLKKPVALANLRGDSRLFEAQVSFLCQTSAAVFIFSDDLEGGLSHLTNTQLFLVTNSQGAKYNMEKLKKIWTKKYNLEEKCVLVRKKENDSEFAKRFRSYVKSVLEHNHQQTNMLDLAVTAQQMGISVDEDCVECNNGRGCAEEISQMVKECKNVGANAEGEIEMIMDVVAFKKQQLPLHGTTWKEISQLEKERYRMRNANREQDIEHYKSSLSKKEQYLRNKQQQTAGSNAMDKFIVGISKPNTERLYFLRWLKIQLDTLTRHHLSSLRQKYKDCCDENTQELIKKLDEQISNCSLGPEHFFRELGQIYECACSLPPDEPARQQVQHLPALCAQMLLDGLPVELVDGDASNIPMRWISAVLTELHNLVETKSRIMVLTVLGVQSTGKSTLLNTMFGVQFAVSSGRCTRGAFMLLMKVSEKLSPELNYDFILVIDTEGLRSPELAALDTSYEHDNELATLVIGLSDITIINVAMENSQEMKDVLQIVVHAFLRMKEVGKKPRCIFVHQNVSDMSGSDKNMRDRNKLVQQLNEMTQAAAKMEKKKANTNFNDVMAYDPDKDSYYIPGLWHGTPPMTPVNPGYSEAVYELKKSLILLFKSEKEANNDATEFLEWTKSLWKSVKYENFIFNFRNSLVADAYSDLCTHYNSWEWTFQSEMNKWLITKTTEIHNFREPSPYGSITQFQTAIKKDTAVKLNEAHQEILNCLKQYFQQKDNKICLVEKNRQDFINSALSFKTEIERSLRQRLEQAVEIKKGKEKLTGIKNKLTGEIETKVLELIRHFKERNTDLSEDDLKLEFNKMWDEMMSELSNVKLQQTDVYQNSLHLLKENLRAKSGRVSEILRKVDLTTSGQGEFIVQASWFSSWTDTAKQWLSVLFDKTHFIEEKQKICNVIRATCCTLVEDHMKIMERQNIDYSDTYIKELLNYIMIQTNAQHIAEECEANLKFHVIGLAAKDFQKAHNEYIDCNNPWECMEKSKNDFLDSFLAVFRGKDQGLKKAKQFAHTRVEPAVQGYVSKHLGLAIANEMKTGDEGVIYNTRTNLQFAVLKQLLEEHSFKKYKKYTTSYEAFVKDWIKQQVIQRLSANGQLARLEKQLLGDIVLNIHHAITKMTKTSDIKEFIQQFCSALQAELVITKDGSDTFLIPSESADTDSFIACLKELIKDMAEALVKGYEMRSSSEDITERIEQLPLKPHALLFSSLCGCGHQCPFCNTPCEAGGQGHTRHFANMDRPQAFGHRVWHGSNKLVTDICTTSVFSDIRFRSLETNGQWHPYNEYREIYPDWNIAGDASVEASDYWKYVLTKFNTELANAYNAEPADIPDEWKKLTKQNALTSLKMAFHK
ncbi:up-regulator of cell proliferation-like [Engraulis encrasicolus]|uniref:up-regulator of cell proliferation-like n=1 Tax=Engraulis encrasicolus TaxID=184585 RepID=UPI002FCEEBBD